ncbi:hypothetical protein AG1IA_09396 [Rhizoctonia solani AG-1 IA]|uniref:Uncharacterized protein n=1 Tax=Thanatephorus cucumeris (strain AG1-IA) TaxID=983506 RepID=L8WJN2_THACA|nr:hypothetical protein AG1IA_09396 [Rhizoctonia solani AG-1 IA]
MKLDRCEVDTTGPRCAHHQWHRRSHCRCTIKGSGRIVRARRDR